MTDLLRQEKEGFGVKEPEEKLTAAERFMRAADQYKPDPAKYTPDVQIRMPSGRVTTLPRGADWNPQQQSFDPAAYEVEELRGWESLTPTERWLYKKLPSVSESTIFKRLQAFGESPVGKLLAKFDFLAEGLERTLGIAAQYKQAVETGTEDLFFDNLGAAWRAGSLFYDSAGIPQIRIGSDNIDVVDDGMPGISALVDARAKIAAGEDLEQVRAELYDDMGALQLRGMLQDAFGHIALDPLNLLLPKLKIPTRLHQIRGRALLRTGIYTDDAVEAARLAAKAAQDEVADIAVQFSKIDDFEEALALGSKHAEAIVEATKATETLAEMEGKTFSPLEKFAIWATGGLPLSTESAALWAAKAPTGAKRLLPWNWFALTPQARAHEVLEQVSTFTQNLVSQADSVDEVYRIFQNVLKGATGDELGHMIATPAGRAYLSWAKGANAYVEDAYRFWTMHQDEINDIHVLAELLDEDVHSMMGRIFNGAADDVFEDIQRALTSEVPAQKALAQEHIRRLGLTLDDIKAFGQVFEDAPYSLERFKFHIINNIYDHVAQLAVTQLGVKAAGFWKKATDQLKAVETLAFLRLNPGYAARNWWNNEITMMARGVWNNWKVDDIYAFFKNRVGVVHPRLLSGFGPAELRINVKSGEGIEEAFQNASRILGDAANGEPGAVERFVQKVGDHLPIDFGKRAAAMESAASARGLLAAGEEHPANSR